MEETFFVKIDDPNSIRIKLLESSKLILHTIRIEKKLEDIRKRKLSQITVLKTHTKELEFLMARFEELLPHQELFKKEVDTIKKSLKKTVEVKDKKVKGKVVEAKEVQVKSKIVEMSKEKPKEVDKISSALAEIEKKLRSLQ
jgi:hypothetical protein